MGSIFRLPSWRHIDSNKKISSSSVRRWVSCRRTGMQGGTKSDDSRKLGSGFIKWDRTVSWRLQACLLTRHRRPMRFSWRNSRAPIYVQHFSFIQSFSTEGWVSFLGLTQDCNTFWGLDQLPVVVVTHTLKGRHAHQICVSFGIVKPHVVIRTLQFNPSHLSPLCRRWHLSLPTDTTVSLLWLVIVFEFTEGPSLTVTPLMLGGRSDTIHLTQSCCSYSLPLPRECLTFQSSVHLKCSRWTRYHVWHTL